jgi:hypothetical protein
MSMERLYRDRCRLGAFTSYMRNNLCTPPICTLSACRARFHQVRARLAGLGRIHREGVLLGNPRLGIYSHTTRPRFWGRVFRKLRVSSSKELTLVVAKIILQIDLPSWWNLAVVIID